MRYFRLGPNKYLVGRCTESLVRKLEVRADI